MTTITSASSILNAELEMSNETLFQDDDYPSTRFYTNGLLAGIFILAGIAANILVITSWLCDRGRWLPLYYYFLAFASWNLTLLISTFFFYSLPALLRQPADQSTIACVPYFYVIGYAGANCCLTAVVWLMVVLTVERYVAVTRPFHTRVSKPRRRAKLISATLSLTAILYNIPLIFELLITGTKDEQQNLNSVATENNLVYHWTVETAPFRNNFYYQTIYRVVANLLFISLLPFLIISTLTMKIVFVVRRTNRDRAFYRRAMVPPTMAAAATGSASSNANKNHQQNHNVSSTAAATYGNVLLTVFVLKFLVCYTLPFALNVAELLLPSDAFETPEAKWVTDVSDFLVILDSVSNAFLYFSWRRRIRFYKKRRTMPSMSKDTNGGCTDYLRSSQNSPCPSLSRTSSRHGTQQQQCQQLLKSFPPPPGVKYYKEVVTNGLEPGEINSIQQGSIALSVPLGTILRAARV